MTCRAESAGQQDEPRAAVPRSAFDAAPRGKTIFFRAGMDPAEARSARPVEDDARQRQKDSLSMSVFGALNTAVSGLSAQSHAFTDISNNISNSQTIGYKATDTDFSDYVLTSSAAQGTNGTVLASTAQQTQTQGTITASTNSLALAISGNGFFNVAEESGTSSTTDKQFQTTQYYTRNGNFSEDNQGYLVNSSNEYLEGYTVNPSTGALDTSKLQMINVSAPNFRTAPTTTVIASASLPGATAAQDPGADAQKSMASSTRIYDSSGQPHTLDLDWSYQGDNRWSVSANVDGSSSPAATASVTFDSTGALQSITSGGTTNAATGSTASLTIPGSSMGSSQDVTVDLGSIGAASGTTMATSATSVGAATTPITDSGTFTGVTMTSDGSVMATFDNNTTQLIAKVPLATFADANALLAHDGQAYTATASSGDANLQLAGQNGAGELETSSVENSTTDLDTDLTKLITAQQAYGANAKIVTTADQMLQTVLSMKQLPD